MNKTRRIILACAFIILAFAEAAQGRRDFVKVSFEHDGKPVKQKFKILIYAGGKLINPPRFENAFVIPPEIKHEEKVRVRIFFGKHNILFEPIYLSKFETDWVVGIDHKPFDQEYVNRKDAPYVKRIYYLRFVSGTGDDTQLVLKIMKKPPSRP